MSLLLDLIHLLHLSCASSSNVDTLCHFISCYNEEHRPVRVDFVSSLSCRHRVSERKNGALLSALQQRKQLVCSQNCKKIIEKNGPYNHFPPTPWSALFKISIGIHFYCFVMYCLYCVCIVLFCVVYCVCIVLCIVMCWYCFMY